MFPMQSPCRNAVILLRFSYGRVLECWMVFERAGMDRESKISEPVFYVPKKCDLIRVCLSARHGDDMRCVGEAAVHKGGVL